MGTPSTAAVRAAAIADETYSRFVRENCPGNPATVHFAGLSQEDIARVIDRETGLPELAAAARRVISEADKINAMVAEHGLTEPPAITALRVALAAVEGAQ